MTFSTPQRRNSSVELFRIIATFLVLIVHFNGWFVGMPERFAGYTTFNIGQTIIESLSCTCVNCFLIITGWYGLRFKWKHIWTIYSVIVCIYIPCYLINSIYTGSFSVVRLILNFIAIGKESYYVQCYLMLLFLSPLLNTFIDKYKKDILPFTLSFWGIEIVFDWILSNKCLGFAQGYELTHFILMYVLGRTLFLYKDDLYKYLNTRRCIVIYIIGTGLISALHLFLTSAKSFSYTNPINVTMTIALFIIFERRTFYNPIVNWFSSSTLAVYILHVTPPLINVLIAWDNYVLINYSYPLYLVIIFGTIVGVFIVGVLYDKIRLLYMPKIGNVICNWLDKKTSKYIL